MKITATIAAVGAVLALSACGLDTQTGSEPSTPQPAASSTEPAAPAPPPTPAAPPPPVETVGQENAVKSATSYLELTGFSAQGLSQQLAYEGFAQADIDYAIVKINPDWNAEAAQSAQSYMELSGFSAQSLAEQLTYEGYTPEQVAAGLAAVGY